MKHLLLAFCLIILVSCNNQKIESTNDTANAEITTEKPLELVKTKAGDEKETFKVEMEKDGKKLEKGTKFHGKYDKFYPDGKKMFEYTYDNGVLINIEAWDKDGNHVIKNGTGKISFYQENGTIINTMTFRNSKLHDTLTTYTKLGKKYSEQYYIDGVIQGTTEWDDKGVPSHTKIQMK
jgi:antitoxin component YwqK of YwqJK toxin-antitoxin module